MSSTGSWMDETENSTAGQDLRCTQCTLSRESILFLQLLNTFFLENCSRQCLQTPLCLPAFFLTAQTEECVINTGPGVLLFFRLGSACHPPCSTAPNGYNHSSSDNSQVHYPCPSSGFHRATDIDLLKIKPHSR